ncbi:MAG: hypothetical protein QOG94_3180 [Solirubrobacteraceae bacterium]|nr:hypothetical protein [Solirubrobacteraceae bacterium]
MHLRTCVTLAAIAIAVAVAVAGCGSSSSIGDTPSKPVDPNAREVSPAGDIPDDQAFVAYAPRGAGFVVKVPEGWSRSASGGAVTFTDKLNAIRIQSASSRAPLTVAHARSADLPKLARGVKGYRPGKVSAVRRKAGTAIRITYLAAARPNAVTAKAGTDAVERYVFAHGARRAILTLSGPKGADNVDPWRIVSDSLTWSR